MKRFNKRIIKDRIASDDDLFEVQNVTSDSIRLRPKPIVSQEGTMIDKEYLQPIENYLDALETKDGYLQDVRGVVASQNELNDVNDTAITAVNTANDALDMAKNAEKINEKQNKRLKEIEVGLSKQDTRISEVELLTKKALDTAKNASNKVNDVINTTNEIKNTLQFHDTKINNLITAMADINNSNKKLNERVDRIESFLQEQKEELQNIRNLVDRATSVNEEQNVRLDRLETSEGSGSGPGDCMVLEGLERLKTLVFASNSFSGPTQGNPNRYFLEIESVAGMSNPVASSGFLDITIYSAMILNQAPVFGRFIIEYGPTIDSTVVRPIELVQSNVIDIAVDINVTLGTHRICAIFRNTQLYTPSFFVKVNNFSPRTYDNNIKWIDTDVRQEDSLRVEGSSMAQIRRNNFQTSNR